MYYISKLLSGMDTAAHECVDTAGQRANNGAAAREIVLEAAANNSSGARVGGHHCTPPTHPARRVCMGMYQQVRISAAADEEV